MSTPSLPAISNGKVACSGTRSTPGQRVLTVARQALKEDRPLETPDMQVRERPDDAPLVTGDEFDGQVEYPKSFTLADYHIALIGQAVISWIPLPTRQ